MSEAVKSEEKVVVKKFRKPAKKKVAKIRKYITEKGKILPRRQTGVCAHHQRQLSLAIKRARNVALLPYVGD